MKIYRVTLSELGYGNAFATHTGVANSIDEAMSLALAKWTSIEDDEDEMPELEVKSVECLGACDFTGQPMLEEAA